MFSLLKSKRIALPSTDKVLLDTIEHPLRIAERVLRNRPEKGLTIFRIQGDPQSTLENELLSYVKNSQSDPKKYQIDTNGKVTETKPNRLQRYGAPATFLSVMFGLFLMEFIFSKRIFLDSLTNTLSAKNTTDGSTKQIPLSHSHSIGNNAYNVDVNNPYLVNFMGALDGIVMIVLLGFKYLAQRPKQTTPLYQVSHLTGNITPAQINRALAHPNGIIIMSRQDLTPEIIDIIDTAKTSKTRRSDNGITHPLGKVVVIITHSSQKKLLELPPRVSKSDRHIILKSSPFINKERLEEKLRSIFSYPENQLSSSDQNKIATILSAKSILNTPELPENIYLYDERVKYILTLAASIQFELSQNLSLTETKDIELGNQPTSLENIVKFSLQTFLHQEDINRYSQLTSLPNEELQAHLNQYLAIPNIGYPNYITHLDQVRRITEVPNIAHQQLHNCQENAPFLLYIGDPKNVLKAMIIMDTYVNQLQTLKQTDIDTPVIITYDQLLEELPKHTSYYGTGKSSFLTMTHQYMQMQLRSKGYQPPHISIKRDGNVARLSYTSQQEPHHDYWHYFNRFAETGITVTKIGLALTIKAYRDAFIHHITKLPSELTMLTQDPSGNLVTDPRFTTRNSDNFLFKQTAFGWFMLAPNLAFAGIIPLISYLIDRVTTKTTPHCISSPADTLTQVFSSDDKNHLEGTLSESSIPPQSLYNQNSLLVGKFHDGGSIFIENGDESKGLASLRSQLNRGGFLLGDRYEAKLGVPFLIGSNHYAEIHPDVQESSSLSLAFSPIHNYSTENLAKLRTALSLRVPERHQKNIQSLISSIVNLLSNEPSNKILLLRLFISAFEKTLKDTQPTYDTFIEEVTASITTMESPQWIIDLLKLLHQGTEKEALLQPFLPSRSRMPRVEVTHSFTPGLRRRVGRVSTAESSACSESKRRHPLTSISPSDQ